MNDEVKNESVQIQAQPQAVRLPLWKSALEDLRAEGLHYGKQIPAEWFEERLRDNRDSMQYSLSVSAIRRELEMDGFYLSGVGQKGGGFVILEPSQNAAVMESYQRIAIDSLNRGVILGTNTRLDTLSQEARLRHEQVLERIAIRALLMSKSTKGVKVTRKTTPKLLEP